MGRFELPASASRTQRATGLRHIPFDYTVINVGDMYFFNHFFRYPIKLSIIRYPLSANMQKFDFSTSGRDYKIKFRGSILLKLEITYRLHSIACLHTGIQFLAISDFENQISCSSGFILINLIYKKIFLNKLNKTFIDLNHEKCTCLIF